MQHHVLGPSKPLHTPLLFFLLFVVCDTLFGVCKVYHCAPSLSLSNTLFVCFLTAFANPTPPTEGPTEGDLLATKGGAHVTTARASGRRNLGQLTEAPAFREEGSCT